MDYINILQLSDNFTKNLQLTKNVNNYVDIVEKFRDKGEIMRIFKIVLLAGTVAGMMASSASTYEYRRELREGARGKWTNLRQHLNSGQRLDKELVKVDKQIDKKVSEIQQIEDLLFKIEKYKVENGIR